MSGFDIERLVISKVVETSDIGQVAAAGITGEFFTDPDAAAVWATITAHAATHGGVPSIGAVRSDHPTYRLVAGSDPLSALIERLRERRRAALLAAGITAAVDAHTDADYDGAANAMATTLLAVAKAVPATRDVDLTTTTGSRMERYAALASDPASLRGIPSGFASIDAASGGFQKGQLVTFVGPPKAGKSVLMALAALSAHSVGVSPLLVGFEMSNEETEERLDAFRSGISHARLRSGRLSTSEWEKLDRTLTRMEAAPPFYLTSDSHSTATLTAIAAKVETLRPDIVLVDGVYMMSDEQGEDSGSPQALTNITRGFKRMAMNLDVPIIISTQVLEWKMDRRKGITSSSIGYSSSFAQDSDLVLGIERTDEVDVQKVKVVLARNAAPMDTFIRWDWDSGTFTEEAPPDESEDGGDF